MGIRSSFLVGLALLGACDTEPAEPAPPSSERLPHVVIIDVDTLRADRLGCYGYERPTSPRIDAWARENAVVYTDAVAAGNWTLPSTISMLTGLSVPQHGVTEIRQVMDPGHQPLAERLRTVGYRTFARTDGGILSGHFGFDQGFDEFVAKRRSPEDHQALGWQAELERLRECQRQGEERPFFLFMQTYQVHEPYVDDRRFEDPESPYRSVYMNKELLQRDIRAAALGGDELPGEDDQRYISDLYDAGVRRMDDVVGAFLEGLDEIFGDEPRLVIITSDHGEELFERGLFGHGHSLHREVLAVPLIVKFPGNQRVGVDHRPASSLDIVPTVLAYAGLEPPEHLTGFSLRGPLPEHRLRLGQHRSSAWSVQVDGWKLLIGEMEGYGGPSDFPELYRMELDPWERESRASNEPELVQQLTALGEELLADSERCATVEAVRPIDPDLVEDLEALGYLGGD